MQLSFTDLCDFEEFFFSHLLEDFGIFFTPLAVRSDFACFAEPAGMLLVGGPKVTPGSSNTGFESATLPVFLTVTIHVMVWPRL